MTADVMSCRSPVFLGHGAFQEAYAKVKPRLRWAHFFYPERIPELGPSLHDTRHRTLGIPGDVASPTGLL